MKREPYLRSFKSRPLLYIIDGKIQKAPTSIVNCDITPEFIEEVTNNFRNVEPGLRRVYYQILKTDFESWNSFDQPFIAAFVPLVAFMAMAMVNSAHLTLEQTALDVAIVATATVAWLAIKVRPIAIKRSKGLLFLQIIEEIDKGS